MNDLNRNVLPLYYLKMPEPEYIYLSFAKQWKKSRVVWETVDIKKVPDERLKLEEMRIFNYS